MVQVLFEGVLVIATAVATLWAWRARGRGWWALGFGSIGAAALLGALHYGGQDVDLVYRPLVAWARSGGIAGLVLGAVSTFQRDVPFWALAAVLLVGAVTSWMEAFQLVEAGGMLALLVLGILGGQGWIVGAGIGAVLLSMVLQGVWPEGRLVQSVDVGHAGVAASMLCFGWAARRTTHAGETP